jgi:HK97 gp10 family phage protein
VVKNVRVKIDLDRALKFAETKALAGMERASAWLEGTVKRSFKPGTGRKYRRGRKYHIASAPGRPPAVDTGRLRASITHEVHKEGDQIVGLVGTNVEYAPHLEFGTNKMAARPFLRPALFNNVPEIKRQIVLGVKIAGEGR